MQVQTIMLRDSEFHFEMLRYQTIAVWSGTETDVLDEFWHPASHPHRGIGFIMTCNCFKVQKLKLSHGHKLWKNQFTKGVPTSPQTVVKIIV